MKNLILSAFSLLLFPVLQAQESVQPFMPEVFKDMPYVRDLAISPDGQEMYFTVDDYRHTVGFMVRMVKKRKGWSSPEIVPWSGRYRDIEPSFSPDGMRLYFASNRPFEGETEPKDYDIYYVERKKLNKSWADPVRLSPPVNGLTDEFFPSVDEMGHLYFTAEREGGVGREDIYMAQWTGRQFLTPQPVKGAMNTEAFEFNAYVPADASYIIFTSYRPRDGRNRSDLYISTRTEDGTYGEAQLLEGIYSDAIEYCPFVKDGILYFTSERNEIQTHYDKKLNLNQFLEMVDTQPNGMGRIYSVDFNAVLRSILP